MEQHMIVDVVTFCFIPIIFLFIKNWISGVEKKLEKFEEDVKKVRDGRDKLYTLIRQVEIRLASVHTKLESLEYLIKQK